MSCLCVFGYVHALAIAIFMEHTPDEISEPLFNLLNIWFVIYPLLIWYGSSKFFRERSGSNIKKLMFYTFISVSGPLPLAVYLALNIN
jgi:hypothetical protein